jgi:uncharacterized protein DUF4261
MPKGFFSQGVCLLTDGHTTIAAVRSAIVAAGFHVAKDVAPQKVWCFGGPGILVPHRPEANGAVQIDVCDQPWPDSMGDPKSDPMTFGAWSMGYFGPFAYPGGLNRAIQYAWGWKTAAEIVPTHRGFIRVRISYIGGLPKDAPCLPKEYDPSDELAFISRIVVAIGNAPGVLCYFNPNGEVLRDLESFRVDLEACATQQKLPLLLWTNARLFKLDDAYGLMDIVGSSQFDIRDIETIYPIKRYDPNTIGYYIRNVTHYLLDLGRDIQTDESIDGPSENMLSWTVEAHDNGLVTPPRRVLRLYPKADARSIRGTLAAAGMS